MKKKLFALCVSLALAVGLMTCSAFAATEAGIYDIQSVGMSAKLTPQTKDGTNITSTTSMAGKNVYKDAVRFKLEFTGTANTQYFVVVCKGDTLKQPDLMNTVATVYVNQYAADTTTIVCDGVNAPYPSSLTNGGYSVFANGTKLATFQYYSSGVPVNGQVTSANAAPATVNIYNAGTETPAAPAVQTNASGAFTFDAVPAGKYDLVVTKDGCLPYTIKNVVVGDAALDLTAKNGITLIDGELNNDGSVNYKDLNIVWDASNYNKAVANAAEKLTDVNGDGSVNYKDLNIVWDATNYNKGVSNCTVDYNP